MPASNTLAADAPTVGQSHVSLNEPSMEDILASIRRIIAEDQSNTLGRSGLTGLARRASQPASPPKEPTEALAPQPEVVSAPEVMVELPMGEPPAAVGDLADHAVLAETHDEPAPMEIDLRGSHDAIEFEAAAPDHHGHAVSEMAAFVDHAPEAASEHPVDRDDHEFGSIEPDRLPSVADQEPLISSAAGASITSSFQTLADTVLMQDPELIERIMRETLRPMLKTWLDDHLPSLVERLVRHEIERVARGGRSRD